MADEVLKYITSVEIAPAIAAFKKLEQAANSAGAAAQKTSQATRTAAGSSLGPIPNLFGDEIKKMHADLEGLRGGLGEVTTASESTFSHLGALGPVMTALGGPIAIVTGALIAQATAFGLFSSAVVSAGLVFDDAMKTMAGRTGETGEALARLGEDFLGVFATVPQSAAEVTEVISKLHQRFDLTGESLREVSRGVLDFSRVTGTPLKAAMDSLVDVMASWDLKAQDMPRLIDMMTVAFQKSGVEVPKMAAYLEGNDAALKQFGFTLTESIALIANLEKRGVNVQKIMTGFNKAAPAFAEAGIDPIVGFDNAVRMIRDLDNEHALLIAKQTFGAKVAVEFADAIRSGAFDTFEMKLALEESAGALELAAANSMTLTDTLKELKNATMAALAPLGSNLVGMVEGFIVPAFAIFLFKLYETINALEYLAGISPKLTNLDIAKATHTGLGGAAPALPMQQMVELSGKAPRQRSAAMSFADYMARMKEKGGRAGARAEKEIDPEKFNRDFRAGELRIFQDFDRAGDQFQKNWQSRLRGTADLSLKELQNHGKAATEILKQNGEIRVASASTEVGRIMAQHELDRASFLESELFKTATAEQQAQLRANFEELFQAKQDAVRRGRMDNLRDEIALLTAETSAGGTGTTAKFRGELAKLAVKQQIDLRKARETGADASEITLIQQRQGLEVLQLQQQQYDTMFGKVKTQAEGVFDAIFLRGKKGFAGLLDYIKGTFITGLKDLFGNLVATLFTGSRPGGGRAAQGGLFGGIAQLFGGGARAGGGGGLFSGLGGLFGGGGGGLFGGSAGASTPPFLPTQGGGVLGSLLGVGGSRSGFGGIGSLLGIGGAGLGAAAATGGFVAGGVAGGSLASIVGAGAVPSFLLSGGTVAGTAGTAGVGTGLSAGGTAAGGGAGLATLGALLSNPITIAAGIGLAATILFLKLRKTREEKFAKEIQRDFGLLIEDGKILKQIKQAGEAAFGKDADKKRFETLRLDQVQGLLLNYAVASGQDPSRLPIHQKFYGTASRSLSFDPSKGIPAFEFGTPYVPQTGLAMVHQGEAIIPAAQNVNGRGGDTFYIDARGATSDAAPAIERAVKAVIRKENRFVTRQVSRTINGDFERRNILNGLIGT